MTSETERVRENGVDFTGLSLVECEVEVIIDFRVIITLLMIDRGRNNIVVERLGVRAC